MNRIAIALAVVGVMATPPTASAQQSSPGVVVADGAWKLKVIVSVLGGHSLAGTRLYWFPDPFDPETGDFSVNGKLPIGPAATGNGKKIWVAPSNSTTLGVFRPGTELVFGLWLPNNTWLFSGSASTGANFGLPPRVPRQLVNGIPTWQTGDVVSSYGWETNPNGVAADYDDFVFMTTESAVTPEPATLMLLGSGLLGFGGIGAFRRRRS